mgnify:CR=1 FL=1
MSKIRVNDSCWCGSGKKYKKCHLGKPDDVNIIDDSNAYNFDKNIMAHAIDTLRLNETDKNPLKIIKEIKKQKNNNTRPIPSDNLILGQSAMGDMDRKKLLDIVAEIVDQNWCGRSEMCIYFSILLKDALKYFNINAKVVIGKARYLDKFEWDHSWVVYDKELVDGNVDSMEENPMVPSEIRAENYWGRKDDLPNDRVFKPEVEADEVWIKQNTSYEELEKWRSELDKKIKEMFKI